MKQVFSTIAILILLMVANSSVFGKGLIAETESYSIYSTELIASDANFDKSWVVEYGNSNKLITISKRVVNDGEEYIVRNDFFEVRYTNTSKGFSAKMVKKNDSRVNTVINDAVINKDQMEQQSLLSQQKLSEDKAISYIASFVPYLLNDNYKHLLN